MACAGVLVSKGFIISICSDVGSRSIFMQTLAVFGLFIPQTLLAIFSTIGWSKASLKILLHHPSLILLPTFTFFTFAKIRTCCGPQNLRIMFSKKFTFYNMVISTIYVAVMAYLSISYLLSTGYNSTAFSGNVVHGLIIIMIIIIMIGVVPTTIFLLYDKLFCCCCSCWLQPLEEVVVFDPEWPDKEMVFTGMGLVDIAM